MVRPNRDRLVGTIEVDETYIGGEKPGKRGRGALGKALVVIAAEIKGPRIGRIRLQRISDASAASLEGAVQSMVERDNKIQTDGWTGYNQLDRLGYDHEVVRKTSEIGENLLPHCSRVASLFKRWLLGIHQGAVAHEHLDYYLNEYTFRFNRRTSQHRGKLFYRLLQNAVALEPIAFKQITKGVRGPKPKNHNM
jgi:transposase-like protein